MTRPAANDQTTKPPVRRYFFRFDASSCSGCKACQIACKDKHEHEVGCLWRRVYEITGGRWRRDGEAWRPDIFAFNLSIACNHCTRPICLEVCPARAITQRDDGIVLLDPDRCLGCSYCEWACPYSAPQNDTSRGVMTKCSFCADEIDAGRPPACVSACPMRVIEFEAESDGASAHEADAAHTQPDAARTGPHLPLPDPTLTEPALRMQPHRDAARAHEEAVEVVPRRRHEMREWSLVVFTLVSQLVAGALIVLAVSRPLLNGQIELAAFDRLSVATLAMLAPMLALGVLLSLGHLGSPRNAHRALANLRTSWLSREVALAMLLTLLTTACIPVLRGGAIEVSQVGRSIVLWCAAGCGLALVFVMSNVYLLRTVPAWNTRITLISFYTTALLLGGILVLVVGWFSYANPAAVPVLRHLTLIVIALLGVAWWIWRMSSE